MTEPRINESSVYYVHAGDNPTLVFVSPALDASGSNYHSWSRNFKMTLLSKNKLDFIDGTLEKPASTSNLFRAWRRCDNLVLSWIRNSLSPIIAKSVVWTRTAQQVWDSLQEQYKQPDVFRIADLHGEIYNIHQGIRSVTEYFSILQVLWDEYLELRPLPQCICTSCDCNLGQSLQATLDENQVICFLKGLNTSFSTIKSQIMVANPLPTLNKTYSLILQHERQFLAPASGSLQSEMAAAVQQTSTHYKKASYGSSNVKKCSHCGYENHTVDTCYKLHGYPPGYQGRTKNKFKDKANAAIGCAIDVDINSEGILGHAPPSNYLASFTDDQVQQFRQFMQFQEATKQQASHSVHAASARAINTAPVLDSTGAVAGRSTPKLSTFQAPGGNKLAPASGELKLERSKTERPRHQNLLAGEAAQILDDKIPVQQKLKLLNRIATVKDDGTVEFEIPGDVAHEALSVRSDQYNAAIDEEPVDAKDPQCIPPLQIVMLIVGTRGDVQPFIAIGKRLQDYGHRVRLATHSNFKEFVLTSGLEFFPLGGDPKVLAGYMVKNKGFLPSGPSEIPIQRNQIKDVIHSLLPACKDPDVDSGIPFKADAIIANPPAYGHTHVAEALKVPIHIFFTMPWTPTSEFPHPLSRVKQSAGYRLSYQIVDSLIWLGIRDMINDFRKKKLKLRPVTYLSGSQGWESDVPHGYIWSPHLVPKPKDWGHKVDVVGFCFLDLASNYEPPEPLMKWLEAGPKPIYIGFGSLPVPEPEKMTQIIVDALEQTGQRGIIKKGWGGLGDLAEPKESIYLLDDCPHDWLFLQCKAVVHHGGAGTTAAGLKAACPTTIVPFFGDQPFWGERVHARGVGPPPIPVDEFSLPKLVNAINFMLDPEVKERAVELAKAMENEDGVAGAVKAFFDHLSWKKPELELEPEPSSFFSFSRWFGDD